MAKSASNDTPKGGSGSNAARLSQSPLSLRRGGADPTDVDDTRVTLGFSERYDYENTMEPSPPIEEMGRSNDAPARPCSHPHRRGALRALQTAAVNAGLVKNGQEPVGLDDLRHSLAANSFGLGLTDVEVARLLRHACKFALIPPLSLPFFLVRTIDVQAL
jgi:hypothetical protein